MIVRSLSVASLLAVIAIAGAGCGGSGGTATTASSSGGGGPASAPAGRIEPAARAVVITSPVPAQVHTAAPDPAGLGRGSVAALAADPEGLSVVVASGTAWSVDSRPGYSTVRITLPPD